MIRKQKGKKRLQRISLYPISLEEALRKALSVKPPNGKKPKKH